MTKFKFAAPGHRLTEELNLALQGEPRLRQAAHSAFVALHDSHSADGTEYYTVEAELGPKRILVEVYEDGE